MATSEFPLLGEVMREVNMFCADNKLIVQDDIFDVDTAESRIPPT
jgi:hypothetical protein